MRVFASPTGGFSAVGDSEPIYHDQLWLFAEQGEERHAIVNAANGLRMVAKTGAHGEADFFVLEGGPVYQDQKWLLHLQADGSFEIVNAKSNRRIAALADANGRPGIAAVVRESKVPADHAWWLINQERDQSAHLASELSKERIVRDQLVHEVEAFKSEVATLLRRLEAASEGGGELRKELLLQRENATHWMLQLQLAMADKGQLAAEMQASQLAEARLTFELDVLSRQNQSMTLLANAQRRANRDLLEVNQQISSQLDHERTAVSNLSEEIQVLSGKLLRLASDLQASEELNSKLEHDVEAAESLAGFLGRTPSVYAEKQAPHPLVVLVAVVAVAFVAALTSSCKHLRLKLAAELAKQQGLIAQLQQDLEEDCTVQTSEVVGELGFDFGFQIINRVVDQETERLVKVQCPGVGHADVDVHLIFNGCDVTIRRQASCGMEAKTWTKRFRFKTSDGLFEFKEDQMLLEHGFLCLVFRAYTFRSRLIRFPRHFSLASSDVDQCWEYPDYDDIGHSYEGISWVQPVTPLAGDKARLGIGRFGSKSHVDSESTASTARELAV
ncbi:unnamed protein product [Polarella glacialis]|uniref:Uncharacterized protein n=1 Tax=Polarella glacialis TaxID=89957 RepID=A0A813LTW3_POLGL|nr:unnamed protein product [Polarella glacialis]